MKGERKNTSGLKPTDLKPADLTLESLARVIERLSPDTRDKILSRLRGHDQKPSGKKLPEKK